MVFMARKRLPNCQDPSMASGLNSKEDMIDNSSSEVQQALPDLSYSGNNEEIETDLMGDSYPPNANILDSYPPKVNVSGTDVRPKEVVLVVLALLVLVLALCLFFKHWKKNYFDINQLPYYAYLYKKDSSVGTFAVCDPAQVVPPTVPVCACERSTSDGLSFWQTASPRPPASKTPSAMAAFTAAAAVAVLADSAGNSRSMSRTVSKRSLNTSSPIICASGKHPRLCKVATRIDLLRSTAKSTPSVEIAAPELNCMLISSNRPQRFLPPSRAQSDVQTRLHLCNRPLRSSQFDTFRRNDSSSALLLLSGTTKKMNQGMLKKGFSENSARKEMCEKLARLDSVSDSCEEDKDEDEISTDETKGLFHKRSKPKVQILEKKKVVEDFNDLKKISIPENDVSVLKDNVNMTGENQNNDDLKNQISVKNSSFSTSFISTKVEIINEGKNKKPCSIVTTV